MTPNYSAGPYTYGEPDVVFIQQGAVCRVGSYCSIAGKVTIFLGGEHRTDTVSSYPFYERDGVSSTPNAYAKGDVTIGSDVWIGQGATILSGVTVGDGAVIGAYALVASDVPPYAVAVGNPAQVVRYRFNKRQIRQLLEVRWWEWERGRVEQFAGMLSEDDIDAFLEAVL